MKPLESFETIKSRKSLYKLKIILSKKIKEEGS